MNRVMQSLLVFLLVFGFSSCTAPSAGPIADPPGPASTSSPVLSLPAPTDLVPATSIPTSDDLPANFTPVLYGEKYDASTFFLLLGGVQGDIWLAREMTADRLSARARDYDVYTLEAGPLGVRGQAPQFSPSHRVYTIGTEVTFAGPGMVGVIRGWPVLQRDVRELDPGNELYRRIVLDWLEAEGVAGPQLDALHILRVDLEGDGADEIFISATHLDGSQHATQAGDYSVILMRKVAGSQAVTLPVVAEIYHSVQPEITFPRTFSLANFIDLNRDGVLEVVVDVQRWEADGAIVYQVDGQDVIETWRVE